MSKTQQSRLVAPAVVTIAGSALAGAVAIGHSWANALVTEVLTLLLAFGYYFLARSNSDVGAIYARHADERQHQVLLRASRLALSVMIGAAFVCVLISVALGVSYWQADLIGSLGGVTYLLGMMFFGAHDSDVDVVTHGVMASSAMPGPKRDLD